MKWIKSIIPDILILSGAASLAYGASLLHPAAGFIVGGTLAFITGVKLAKVS